MVRAGDTIVIDFKQLLGGLVTRCQYKEKFRANNHQRATDRLHVLETNSARWYTNLKTPSLYITNTSSTVRSDSSNEPNYVQISGFDEFAVQYEYTTPRPTSITYRYRKNYKKEIFQVPHDKLNSPSWSSIIFRFHPLSHYLIPIGVLIQEVFARFAACVRTSIYQIYATRYPRLQTSGNFMQNKMKQGDRVTDSVQR